MTLTVKQQAYIEQLRPVAMHDTITHDSWAICFIAWFLGWHRFEELWPDELAQAADVNDAIDFLKRLDKTGARV